MRKLVTFISRSLATKLILSILSLIIIGGGLSWYALIRTNEKNLIADAVKDAASSSELVERSVRSGMLAFNREAIQRTIDDLKSARVIKGITLFNSSGRIQYSSDRDAIGRQVDPTARPCRGCHGSREKPFETLSRPDQWNTSQGPDGHNMLTYLTPIMNEPSCSAAACHAHPAGQRVLGVLQADFSLASVDENIRKQSVSITVYAFALMGLVSVVLYAVVRKIVLKPLTALSDAMGTVAQGNLGKRVAPASRDEIGLLARTFNSMTRELEVARERMEDWTASLEREVTKKSNELKKSQDRLIQAEKLAALGRLTADVAHEIRNPLTAIGGFARRLLKSATGEKEKQRADIIVSEVDRLEKILREVLTFSRDARSRLDKHRVEDLVSDAAKMHTYICTERSIALESAVEKDLPPVLMDKDQVRQALTNLITNAIDAMPRGGSLKISAGKERHHDVGYVFLRVSDTGHGIDEEKLPLIFDPFFTTKAIGQGTGLGLSITRKIVEEHGGFIRAESVKGSGSDFSLYFPQQSEEESREVPCWQFMQCGRDKDATSKCPAFPHFGRICWAVAGTFCEGKVQGSFAQKCEDCRKCAFYRTVRKERE
jgi:two-component system NtrC family sensor kinase